MPTPCNSVTDSDFQIVFLQLREFFAAHAPACVVLHDEPHRYYLGTHHLRQKDGYRLWFGGVEIKKSYVSAHVMAVYVYPELLGGIGEALKRRMQGKACFNFKKVENGLFEDLRALVNAGASAFAQDRRLLDC